MKSRQPQEVTGCCASKVNPGINLFLFFSLRRLFLILYDFRNILQNHLLKAISLSMKALCFLFLGTFKSAS